MRIIVQYPFWSCCLVLSALFFDGTGLFGCTLVAIALHEGGHMLAYRLIIGQGGVLRVAPGGIALLWQRRGLRPWQQAVILSAGPFVNFTAGCLCAWLLSYRARYILYFFGGANWLLGIFNLLPLGFLDGGQLLALVLQRLLPQHTASVMTALQYTCLALLCAGFFYVRAWIARLALLLFLIYYIGKSFCSTN